MERAEIKQAPEQAQEKSFQNTLNFLAAQVYPVDHKIKVPPKLERQTQSQWERTLRITGIYFGTSSTLDDIAGLMYSRERIRQLIKKTITELHGASSEDSEKEFPLESFGFDKRKLAAVKTDRLQKSNSLSLQVFQMLYEGKTVSEIRQELGSVRVNNAIQTIRSWGIVLSAKETPHAKYAHLNDPNLSTAEVQEIIDGFTRPEAITISRGSNPIISKLSKFVRNSGYHISNRELYLFAQTLKNADIAVSHLHIRVLKLRSGKKYKGGYYYIRSLDKEKAKAAFENNPELSNFKTNPVKVLGAPCEKIPTTTTILYSDEYLSLVDLITEIRGRRIGARNRIRTTDLIDTTCPVSVFTYKGKSDYRKFRYHQNNEELLRKYLTSRLIELGLL